MIPSISLYPPLGPSQGSQSINFTDSQLTTYHIAEKAYQPSGSTAKSSSHRTSSDSKVVIHYPSTYKDQDRRKKQHDSEYFHWGIRFIVLEGAYHLHDMKIVTRYLGALAIWLSESVRAALLI